MKNRKIVFGTGIGVAVILAVIMIFSPTSESSVFALEYNIESPCDLAYFISYHDTHDTFGGAHFDLRGMPQNDPKDVKELQDIVYSKYEKWEIETNRQVQIDVSNIKRDFVYDLETQYALKHHDINPKFYDIVDKGLHFISSPNYDQDKMDVALFAAMAYPDQYGYDNECEKKYLEEFDENFWYALNLVHKSDPEKIDIVWSEIQSRVYD